VVASRHQLTVLARILVYRLQLNTKTKLKKSITKTWLLFPIWIYITVGAYVRDCVIRVARNHQHVHCDKQFNFVYAKQWYRLTHSILYLASGFARTLMAIHE